MPSIINSDDGVVSGTSGLKSTGGNDGITAFQQNGTERMRITSAGDVGIGTSSPSGKLNISDGTSCQVNINSAAAGATRQILFSTSTNTQEALISANNSTGELKFESGRSGTSAYFQTFYTNNTERMRITSTGAVGIGLTNPTFPLVVQTSGTSTAVAGNVIARFQSTATGYDSTIQFSDNITNSGFISMNSGNMIIGSFGTESIRFKSGGTVILQNGSTSATGIGITFPATQSASSDANTLDDYEEGSFTPTVAFGITSPTYSTQSGFYTKIGNIYYWQMRLVVTGGTLNSSTLTIGGMPFTSSAGSGSNGVGLFSYVHPSIVNSTTTNTPTIYVPPSTTLLEFYNTAGASFGGTSLVSLPDFYLAGWIRT